MNESVNTYKCPLDDCQFSSKKGERLLIHIKRSHSGKLFYICKNCTQCYHKVSQIIKHVEKKHSELDLKKVRFYFCAHHYLKQRKFEGCKFIFKVYCALCDFKSMNISKFNTHFLVHSKELYSSQTFDADDTAADSNEYHISAYSQIEDVANSSAYDFEESETNLENTALANGEGKEKRKSHLIDPENEINDAESTIDLDSSECKPNTTKRGEKRLLADTEDGDEIDSSGCQPDTVKSKKKKKAKTHLFDSENNDNKINKIAKKKEVTNPKKKRPSMKGGNCPTCGKFVKNISNHMITHSNEYKFVCDFCEYRTHWSRDLTIHKKTVHYGIKTFECEQCSNTFRGKSDLLKHYRVHDDERKFACSICTAQFKLRHHLQRHILLVHKITDNDSEV